MVVFIRLGEVMMSDANLYQEWSNAFKIQCEIIEALQKKVKELEYRIMSLEENVKSIKYYGVP
jgi:hypothetical protein